MRVWKVPSPLPSATPNRQSDPAFIVVLIRKKLRAGVLALVWRPNHRVAMRRVKRAVSAYRGAPQYPQDAAC